jgi:hypothetical protein
MTFAWKTARPKKFESEATADPEPYIIKLEKKTR